MHFLRRFQPCTPKFQHQPKGNMESIAAGNERYSSAETQKSGVGFASTATASLLAIWQDPRCPSRCKVSCAFCRCGWLPLGVATASCAFFSKIPAFFAFFLDQRPTGAVQDRESGTHPGPPPSSCQNKDHPSSSRAEAPLPSWLCTRSVTKESSPVGAPKTLDSSSSKQDTNGFSGLLLREPSNECMK